MPEIDSLDIKISAEASKADKAIDRLIGKLGKLSSALDFDTNITGINKQKQAFDSLGDTIKGISGTMDSLKKSMSGMSDAVAPQTQKLANTIARIATAGDKSEQAAKSLPKIGGALSKVTADMAGVKNIDSSINRFTSSITRLASAGDKSAVVAKELPKVGNALKDVADKMAKVEEISDSTNSFTQAIAQLASAGDKAGKAAAGLDQLADGTLRFFNTMKNAPQISENTIRMTQAMAQLSATGGRTSASIRSTNSTFQTVSKSLQSLSNVAKKASDAIKKAMSGIAKIVSGAFSKIGQIGLRASTTMKRVAGDMVAAFERITHSSRGLNTASSNLKSLLKTILGFKGAQALYRFGKSAIELGSDITEVENVVDVAFGNMAQSAYDFAKTATEKFGLSELAAKQYSGTMMAMLKSTGVAIPQAAEMSTRLAGLAGDLASFYNIETDEAFYKLRSAMAGMVAPMRALGVNMHVANLEAFALSQGITKAYKDMTQAEKSILRYNYLLAQTTDAQGDFARTAGTWANQVRLLKLNFQSLSAVIGQGLIAALLPAIKWLNALMSKLMEVAKTFRNFMYTLTGFQKPQGGGGIVDDLADVGDAAGDLGDLGDAAEDAGKKIKKNLLLLPFDELNVLSEASSDIADDLEDIGDIDTGLGDIGNFDKFDDTPVNEWAKKLRDAFLAQDWEGLGRTIAELINKGLEWLYKKIKQITPKVEKALKNLAKVINSFIKNLDWDLLGKTIGAGINLLTKAFNALFGDDGINLELIGEKLSTGLRGMIDEVDWRELGNAIGNYLMIAWRIAYGFIEDMWRIDPNTLLTGWAEAGNAIGDTLVGIFERIDFEKISAVLTEGFKGALETITYALNRFSENLDWIVDKINLGLDRLYDGLKWDSTAGQDMGQKITALTDAISTAFNKLLDLDFGKVGQIIGAGITDIVRAFNQISDIGGGIDFEKIGKKLSDGLRGLVTEIPWEEFGNALGNGFMLSWRILDGFLTDMAKKSDAGLTGWQEIGVAIGNAINGLFEKIDLNTISSNISRLVNGITSIIYEAFNGIDWGGIGTEIGHSIKKTLEDIDFAELGRALGTVFQSAIDFLKGIISQVSFKDIVDAIMELLKGFFEKANWEDVASVILTAFGGSLINLLPGKIKMIGFATAVIYLFADEFKKVDWTAVGETIAESINNFLSNIDGARLAKGASDLMNGLFEAISSCVKNIDWSQVWEIIIEFLTNINYLDALMLPIKFAEIGLYLIAGLIKGLVEAIFNTDWSQIWNDILDTFKEFFGIHSPSTVMEEQGGFLMEGLINGIVAFIGNVAESFRELVDEIKKALEEKWNELVEWWNNTAIVKWWNESVKPWFTKEKWSELYDSIKTGLEEKWNGLVEWWDNSGAKEWIDGHVKPWFTIEKWKETYHSVKQGLVDKWGELKSWWQNTNFSEWIDNHVKPYFTKEKWSEIYHNFKQKFEDKWAELKKWWKNADFSEWIKEHVSPHFVTDKWEKIYEPIKSSLKTKWEQMTEWWNNSAMKKWFENDVKPWFSEKNWTWEGIKEGLSKAFDNAVEAIKGIWNTFAEWLNSKLTFEIPPIDIMGFHIFDGVTLDFGKLPTFATGGYPNLSKPFIVGENGPEIFGGMYGKPAVANNDSITEGIRKASHEGMVQALSEMFPYLADIAENTRRTAEKDMSVTIGDRDIYDANKRGAARAGYDFGAAPT